MSGDPLKELAEALDAARLRLTISPWCRSGIVGRDACVCWRCRGEDGPAEDESVAEEVARRIDAEALEGKREPGEDDAPGESGGGR